VETFRLAGAPKALPPAVQPIQLFSQQCPCLAKMVVNFPRHGWRGATVNWGTKKLCFWGSIRVNFLLDVFM
jgi:hypothetical protein